MNMADLQQLRDIHLPPPIHPWWPLAYGYIILLLLLCIAIIYLFYVWVKIKKQRYTARFALNKLKHLQQTWKENRENTHVAAEISTLLRRTALHYFDREEIAGLTGKEWLSFLNHSGNTTKFTEENGFLFTDAPYRKDRINDADLAKLFALVRDWLMTISKKK